jgi:hypothetical protein
LYVDTEESITILFVSIITILFKLFESNCIGADGRESGCLGGLGTIGGMLPFRDSKAFHLFFNKF